MDCKIGVRTYLEEELAKAKEKPKLRKVSANMSSTRRLKLIIAITISEYLHRYRVLFMPLLFRCLGYVRENDSDRPERAVGRGTPAEGRDKT